DALPREHRVAPPRDATLVRELEQQPERLVSDAVLRVVEEDPLGLERQALATLRILLEQGAQVNSAQLICMRLELLPGGCLAQRGPGRRRHAAQAALSARLFCAMFSISSSHDFTKESAPSARSRVARPSMSTAAWVKRRRSARRPNAGLDRRHDAAHAVGCQPRMPRGA